ncbi:MAG: peptide ABC transporter permease [Caldiserica bacterium]|nr:MAG: peptide ABC transporter permease [Caldisericota bacterium]
MSTLRTEVQFTESKPESYLSRVTKRFLKHKLAIIGLISVGSIVIFSFIVPLFFEYGSTFSDFSYLYGSPNSQYLLGTDSMGHDLFTRLMYGGRISLIVGFSAAIIPAIFGIIVGAVAGYYGGLADNILMRITDAFLSVPAFPIYMALAKLMGQGVLNIILVFSFLGWMTNARIVRGMYLSLKENEYTEAAKAIGVSNARIIFRHLLPNTMAPILVSMTLTVGGAILSEAGLSFLGLGVPPSTPTWGNMLTNSQQDIFLAPRLVIWPGIMIFLTVLSFNFIGDGLRDALDPKLYR